MKTEDVTLSMRRGQAERVSRKSSGKKCNSSEEGGERIGEKFI